MALQVRGNHALYLINDLTAEWAGCHTFVCGFGKGAFKLFKLDGSDVPVGAQCFHIESGEDMVVLGGATVAAVRHCQSNVRRSQMLRSATTL